MIPSSGGFCQTRFKKIHDFQKVTKNYLHGAVSLLEMILEMIILKCETKKTFMIQSTKLLFFGKQTAIFFTINRYVFRLLNPSSG